MLGAPGSRPLPRLPADTMLADLHRLGWRTDLVFQLPRERAQPLGAEIPLALRQLRDITPPGVSPLAEDADVVLGLAPLLSYGPHTACYGAKCSI